MMPGILEFSWSWDFLLRFLSISLIDLSLSGDNAIVIGMAAASLPAKERKRAILFGGGLAIVLRVLLTAIASLLMTLSLLSAIGGSVLFWVAWKLMRMDVEETATEEEQKAKRTRNFRQAIIVIITADLMMSLDNIIAVAGTAHGNIVLLILGLLLSMPLLIGAGGAISLLIDRFKWLIFAGAAVIVFAGARMIFEDRFVSSRIHVTTTIVLIISAVIGITVPVLFVRFNRSNAKPPQTTVAQAPPDLPLP
jgi:YjbE family integral membrane protein